jgi:TorA maturation chaperone TorD
MNDGAAHEEEEDELDQARAGLYTLLAALLARPPVESLLELAAGLEGSDTPLGRAVDELAERAAAGDQRAAEREFNALFIGVERGELVPYASYYRTGFLHDRPLARLRQDMQGLGLERRPGVAEPEDHIASLCEIMAGLVAEEAGTGVSSRQRAFFERHLGGWGTRFFGDLENAREARLYRPIGTIGRLLLEIDAAAWALSPSES